MRPSRQSDRPYPISLCSAFVRIFGWESAGSIDLSSQRSPESATVTGQKPNTAMKPWSWALIVAGLYASAVMVLIVPLGMISFGYFPDGREIVAALRSWQLWLLVLFMFISQLALLAVPVRVASRSAGVAAARLVTLLAAAFMMGLLVFGASASIYEFMTRLEGKSGPWWPVCLGLGSWLFWSFFFYRSSKSLTYQTTISQQRKMLLSGSILDLLIAVPTHIVARQRDYCCAGMMTFIGLTAGVSVMLFAFGPALYFLFTERWRKLHPDHDEG